MSLFGKTVDATDPYFLALRDDTRFAVVRRHVEELWSRFSDYADPHFSNEISTQFLSRYWEMYLGSTLLELGFTLHPTGGAGPDLSASKGNMRVLLEARSVGPGLGSDSVPEPPGGEAEAQPVPINRITLRITSAIRDKNIQRASHAAQGLLPPDLPFVIAIHVGGISSAHTNSLVPLCAHACLGIRNVGFRIGGGPTPDRVLVPRANIQKSSGEPIDTRMFLMSESSGIAGLLLASVNPFSIPPERGGFEYLHNPSASHPLPRGWFKKGVEYWMEEDMLTYQEHDAA